MLFFLTKAILWLPVAVNLAVVLGWVLLLADTTRLLVLALQVPVTILGVGFVIYHIYLARRAWEIDPQHRSFSRYVKEGGGSQRIICSIVFGVTVIFAM
jgi:hypothetical protein